MSDESMNQAPEIAERLRDYARIVDSDKSPWPFLVGVLAEAADLITSQAVEIERYRAGLEAIAALFNTSKAQLTRCPSIARKALGDSSLRQEPSHPAVKP